MDQREELHKIDGGGSRFVPGSGEINAVETSRVIVYSDMYFEPRPPDDPEGMYTLEVSFEYGANVDVAYQDALAAMARARRHLPSDIEEPVQIFGIFLGAVNQCLGKPLDRGDRCSQLVLDVGHEPRLHAIQRFELADIVDRHDSGCFLHPFPRNRR